MKKSLIALAALAATASFAQSSVTVYGKANIGFQSTNGSKTALVDQPDGSGSRFGFRGTEDLGGGLKANFTLESGFNLNNGTNDKDSATNQQFQRQSWAGLSSATLGEVRMGRQYTVGFNGSIGTMPSTYSDPALAVGLGFHGMGSRTNDQIQYRSPVFSGFQVQLSTQLAANTTDAATKAAKNIEFGLVYANGPLTANLTGANVTSTTGVKTSPIGANATYNFGVASATLGYVDTDSAKGKGYVAKANVPVGAHSLFVGYAKNDTTKVDAYELGDYYSLSKRTKLYAIYANGNTATAASGKRVPVGLTHDF